MKNLILSALSAGLLLASASAAPASAAVSADINLRVGQAPRVYFAEPPRTILVPGTPVYCVQGTEYDMFQCDGWWYIDNGGYWFRARSYRGPFASVSFATVPRTILNVPAVYAHQPYRPGVWRNDDSRYYENNRSRGTQAQWNDGRDRDDRNDQVRREDGGHGQGHGHGRKRGHDE